MFCQANAGAVTEDAEKSDASTHKPDDFSRSTRKTPKRLPVAAAVVGKPQTAVTETKASDELTSLRTRSPAEPKDGLDSVAAEKKVASSKPKVTRQRVTETGKMPKSETGSVKSGGYAGSMNKKTGATDDKIEKKLPGRPAVGLKAEEKYIKKKLLIQKPAASSAPVDVKRTMNLLVEKVDSHKEDKSSAQKRVSICCSVFCDWRWSDCDLFGISLFRKFSTS